MIFTTGFLLGVWAIALLLILYSTHLTLRHFRSSPSHLDAPFALFPVSILKPLKGKDSGLSENLESFFNLDYPEYELLFSVAESSDPACPVVRDLMQRYPKVRARLIIGAVQIGMNPKINNLIRSYEQASHDWILISDSNVRVEASYLKHLIGELENDTGIVTSVVAGRSPSGLGGHLEATYLNTFYARGMILASSFGHPCVVGKSMLFRKTTAERFGGLRNLARYLAEDYMAGEAMQKLGLQAITAKDPVSQNIGNYSFREFWSRHLRWGRIRNAQAPLAFLAEPAFGSLLSGILGAIAFQSWLDFSIPLFIVIHLAICFLCDVLTQRAMKARVSTANAAYWIVREALSLPLWIHTMVGSTVNWRGKHYAVKPGGLLDSNCEPSLPATNSKQENAYVSI